ncbi:MAG: hypothetical protein INR62_13185 [Rhodospirillales bacterium]|nr:hypothetical protein [Acetobacter sp.]
MAIARKPGSKPVLVQEEAAERFIASAGAAPAPAASAALPATEEAGRKPVMIRFDPDLLARVDRAAKRRGISRSAWVQFVLSHALDQEDRAG